MKIGIITHYYKSLNYGGNLQAYALCKYLNDLGHEAMQISYNRSFDPHILNDDSFFAIQSYRVRRILAGAYRKFEGVLKKQRGGELRDKFKIRNQKISDFNKNCIPHTAKVYCRKNIKEVNELFDLFITGSDQVWHPNAVCGAYLLDFANPETRRIAYAASIAVDEIDKVYLKRYARSLKKFDAISVREDKSIDLIKDISPVDVVATLDPTMLLSKEQWEEVCPPRLVLDAYIFCYFLGDDQKHRDTVAEFAKRKKLKIVTMPNLHGIARECDNDFGDECLYDISPLEFLSLVKYASVVFTDSFHASVFSLLFEKEFFAFKRNSSKDMGVRLKNLTELFDLQNRYCDLPEKISIDYIASQEAIDYSVDFPCFDEMKRRSIAFLDQVLKND